MPADYRKLLETDAFCCVLDVIGWGRINEYPGWVNAGIISTHSHYAWRTKRARLERAWAALKGEAQPFVEFHRREELDAFIAALADASRVAFSEPEAKTDS